MNKINQIMWKL